MTEKDKKRVAILYPGDCGVRENATPDNNRLSLIFKAFADLGIPAEPAVYHDAFGEEVRQQLLKVDAVLVTIPSRTGVTGPSWIPCCGKLLRRVFSSVPIPIPF